MKRVFLSGVTVVNVALGSPDVPTGMTFLDVADSMAVSPLSVWNGSTSSPTFTIPPTSQLADPTRAQVAVGVTSGGSVSFTWPLPFRDVPAPFGPLVFDPAGKGYDTTLTAISATGATLRVSQQRALPAVLLALTTLSAYDTNVPAPDGLTVYLAAKLP